MDKFKESFLNRNKLNHIIFNTTNIKIAKAPKEQQIQMLAICHVILNYLISWVQPSTSPNTLSGHISEPFQTLNAIFVHLYYEANPGSIRQRTQPCVYTDSGIQWDGSFRKWSSCVRNKTMLQSIIGIKFWHKSGMSSSNESIVNIVTKIRCEYWTEHTHTGQLTISRLTVLTAVVFLWWRTSTL